MKTRLKLLILLVLAGMTAAAQSTQSTMTNATVIKLVKSGLDHDIIMTTVESASGKYDVTADGLVSLKNAGVPTNVIKSMIAKMQEGKAIKTPGGGPAPRPGSDFIPAPEVINAVYLYDKAGHSLKPLEKANATQATHRAGLGYGATTYTCEIPGNKSSLRLKENDLVSFAVNAGNGSPDNFKLFKVEAKKNIRSAVTSKITGMGAMKGAQGAIACEIKMLKAGIYQITPTGKLDKGEYLFTTKAFDYTTMSNMDAYAFGID